MKGREEIDSTTTREMSLINRILHSTGTLSAMILATYAANMALREVQEPDSTAYNRIQATAIASWWASWAGMIAKGCWDLDCEWDRSA